VRHARSVVVDRKLYDSIFWERKNEWDGFFFCNIKDSCRFREAMSSSFNRSLLERRGAQ
jgi:hypothetical protein